MATSSVITIVNGTETAAEVTREIGGTPAADSTLNANRLINWISALGNCERVGTIEVQTASVQATGTITFSAANTANDTVLINGTTFTAVASGATGNQWNIGTTGPTAAANLAAAINASASSIVSGIVSASVATNVLTITAIMPGLSGNAVTIAKGTDAGSVMTVSGARLTGGAVGSDITYRYGF